MYENYRAHCSSRLRNQSRYCLALSSPSNASPHFIWMCLSISGDENLFFFSLDRRAGEISFSFEKSEVPFSLFSDRAIVVSLLSTCMVSLAPAEVACLLASYSQSRCRRSHRSACTYLIVSAAPCADTVRRVCRWCHAPPARPAWVPSALAQSSTYASCAPHRDAG